MDDQLGKVIEALRAERESRGWSYRDVDKAGGPSYVMVFEYERGGRLPSVAQIEKWAAALGYEFVIELRCPVAAVPTKEEGCPT